MNKYRNKKFSKTNLRFILIIVGAIIVIYLSVVIIGTHGVLTLIEKKSEKSELSEKLSKDSLELKRLKDYERRLKYDKGTQEKVAREKFNLQKKNETVYKIERNKTDTN